MFQPQDQIHITILRLFNIDHKHLFDQISYYLKLGFLWLVQLNSQITSYIAHSKFLILAPKMSTLESSSSENFVLQISFGVFAVLSVVSTVLGFHSRDSLCCILYRRLAGRRTDCTYFKDILFHIRNQLFYRP